ncbi:MAG: hypothetical protein ACLFQB_03085 [Chitinispirillaceae bacterium]
MSRIKLAARLLLVVSVIATVGFVGCGGSKTGGGKMSQDEQAELEKARKEAVDAEKKLSELRMERKELEKEMSGEGGNQQVSPEEQVPAETDAQQDTSATQQGAPEESQPAQP